MPYIYFADGLLWTNKIYFFPLLYGIKFTRDVHFVFGTFVSVVVIDRTNQSDKKIERKMFVYGTYVGEKQRKEKRTFCLSIQSISGITGEMGGWW